jgi:hypothetical protein
MAIGGPIVPTQDGPPFRVETQLYKKNTKPKHCKRQQNKTHQLALAKEEKTKRNIPTEGPPIVGEF